MMKNRYRRSICPGSLLVVCILGAFSQNAQAQDCSDLPSNLVTNCGFDTELSPWTKLFGTASHDPAEGYLAQGSALVTGGPTGNGFEFILRQCISPIQTDVTFIFSGAIRGQETLPDSCELFVATNTQADCSGGGSFVDTELVPQTNTWIVFPDSELSTTEGTMAVKFEVRCVDATENFSIHFDDAYFGDGSILIDGFEAQ